MADEQDGAAEQEAPPAGEQVADQADGASSEAEAEEKPQEAIQ